MGAHLFLGSINPSIQAFFILSLAATAVIRAWIAYRQIIVKEKARTTRLNRALKGVSPEHRSEIITACGELEKAGRSERRGHVLVKSNPTEGA
jgi:hypothetical protein